MELLRPGQDLDLFSAYQQIWAWCWSRRRPSLRAQQGEVICPRSTHQNLEKTLEGGGDELKMTEANTFSGGGGGVVCWMGQRSLCSSFQLEKTDHDGWMLMEV